MASTMDGNYNIHVMCWWYIPEMNYVYVKVYIHQEIIFCHAALNVKKGIFLLEEKITFCSQDI